MTLPARPLRSPLKSPLAGRSRLQLHPPWWQPVLVRSRCRMSTPWQSGADRGKGHYDTGLVRAEHHPAQEPGSCPRATWKVVLSARGGCPADRDDHPSRRPVPGLGAAAQLRVGCRQRRDADHVPGQVDQRPAAVSWVDRCRGLERIWQGRTLGSALPAGAGGRSGTLSVVMAWMQARETGAAAAAWRPAASA